MNLLDTSSLKRGAGRQTRASVVSVGTTIVTYLFHGACAAPTRTITVNPVPTISGTTGICIGGSTPVSGSARIASVPSTGVRWSMGTSASIATIDSLTGVVTGVGRGTAVITCTVLATGCSATRSITIHELPDMTFANPYPLVACDGFLTLSMTGVGTYTWFGAGLPALGSVGASITVGSLSFGGAATIVYTVTSTTPFGCSATAYDMVVNPECGPGVCEAAGGVPVYGLAGTFGSVSFPPGNYYIYGDVTFNGTTSFSNSIIPVSAGKTIFVGPNGSLDISGSHLFTCSTHLLWQGIVLNSSTGTGASTGTVNIHGNSLLEDAVVGIKLDGGFVSSTANLITADSVVFNRNSIGISIENFPAAAGRGAVGLPYNYPFLIRNSVFTSRKLDVFNNGTTTRYPRVWPAASGGTLALKAGWTPPATMMPPYNLFSPTGAGTVVAGGYGGRYNPVTCKDGSVANIGVQLRNAGEFSSAAGNVSARFGNIVIGDNSAYTGVNTNQNLFDTLYNGIYAYNSNFISYNNAFTYMYPTPVASFFPFTSGDGIGASGDEAPAVAGVYPKYSATVGGSKGTNPTNNVFYDCNNALECAGYYYINGLNSSILTRHMGYYRGISTGYTLYLPRFYEVNITGNTITNVADKGIYMLNTSSAGGTTNQYLGRINISRNTIQANLNGAPPTGSQSTNTAIDLWNVLGTGAGITASGAAAHIDTNNIYYTYNGIAMRNYQNKPFTIDTNYIRLRSTASGVSYGINVQNSRKESIRGNYILGAGPTTPTPHATSGLGAYLASNCYGIYSTANINTTVRCNTTDSVVTGFFFRGAGNITRWYNNVMKDESFGMTLGNNFGPQYGSSGSTSPAFNDWRGSNWTGSHYTTYTLDTIVTGDIINTAANWGVYMFNPTNNFGLGSGTGWFGFGGGATSYTAPYYHLLLTGSLINPSPDACVELRGQSYYYYHPLRRMATTKTYTAEGQQPLNWIAQNSLYGLVASDSAIQANDSTGTLAAFVNISNANSRYSWLAQIADAIAANDTANARSLLGVDMDTYLNIDTDAISGVLMQDDVAADYVVQHYVDYYKIYLAYMGQKMNASDSANLSALAALCPYVDGYVIFEARTLYRYLFKDDTTQYLDDCSLGGIGSRGTAKALLGQQQYKIFPNPNDGSFTVQQMVVDNKEVQLEVRDILGKVIFRNQVTFYNGASKVALANIPAGMYIVQIDDDNGFVINFKLMVQ